MKNLSIFSAIFLVVFATIDLLQRFVITRVNWARKATHIASGVIVLFFPAYMSVTEILIISIAFAALLAISKWIKLLSLHNIQRKTWGELFYPFSIFFLTLICLPKDQTAFKVAVLCLTFSDSLAELIGKPFPMKKIRIGRHRKSVGGFLAFFATTLLIFAIYFLPIHQSFIKLLLIALLLALIEFVSILGTDNFTVPIMAALFVIWWL
jgi:phytol kinase